MTLDVDLLLSPEGLKKFKDHHLSPHAATSSASPRSKGLRDVENRIAIDIVLTAEYPGDGLPQARRVFLARPRLPWWVTAHERPSACRRLIELKLASGMTAPHAAEGSGRCARAHSHGAIRAVDFGRQRLDPYVRKPSTPISGENGAITRPRRALKPRPPRHEGRTVEPPQRHVPETVDRYSSQVAMVAPSVEHPSRRRLMTSCRAPYKPSSFQAHINRSEPQRSRSSWSACPESSASYASSPVITSGTSTFGRASWFTRPIGRSSKEAAALEMLAWNEGQLRSPSSAVASQREHHVHVAEPGPSCRAVARRATSPTRRDPSRRRSMIERQWDLQYRGDYRTSLQLPSGIGGHVFPQARTSRSSCGSRREAEPSSRIKAAPKTSRTSWPTHAG